MNDTDWSFTHQGVETITAASRKEDDGRVAAALITEIDSVLQRRTF